MRTISVIVPVYNAENYLPTLFEKLDKCNWGGGDEVVLVDNGSTDKSRKMCEDKSHSNSLYKVLSYSEKPGSYSARNYALDKAKGDVLVFTDSDCMPEPDWIDIIRQNVNENTVIAGAIEIQIVNNGLWEKFDAMAHLNSELNARNSQVATANMAVLRKEFDRVGKFEERFSGGDYEWSMRAKNKGLSIKYIPEAKVLHPSRKTFEEILKKEKRIAYGDGLHMRINDKSFIRVLLKYILKIFKIDTNIRYTCNLYKNKTSIKELFLFNVKFMCIRGHQLTNALRGYRRINARKIGVQ